MSLLSPSLEAFWAVVQKGTVLEAAKMIDLTQTGVTQRIRSLEKQLGVTLFTRSRKGMRLTNEGESLLRYVKTARDLESETLSTLQGKSSPQVEICISGPSALMRARIIPRLTSAMKRFPQLRVRFDLSDTENALGKLKSGFAQIGILPPGQIGPELDSKTIAPERYVLVGPASWKKRKLEDVLTREAIVDFNPGDNTTLNLLKRYRRLAKASSHRHFANNVDALTSLVKAGLGYSALSWDFAQTHIKEGSLICLSKDLFIEEPMAVAWYPRSEMPPYFRGLVEALTKKSP